MRPGCFNQNYSPKKYISMEQTRVERDMDALNPTLLWNYCHSNNVPLSNEELEGMTYDLFKTLMVRIVWTDYPDQSERLEKKRLALEAKKKSAKKGG